MAFLRVLVLCGLVLATTGCTILGVAADLAILSASDNEKERTSLRRNGVEPIFTQIGLEQDIEFVKNLIAKLPEKELNPVSQEANQNRLLACKSVIDGKQQCYPAEYYKDMYITNSDNHDEETVSAKD